MTDIARHSAVPQMPGLPLSRSLLIGVIGFLTLVDLFATQAILPSLAVSYKVSASEKELPCSLPPSPS